jgi:hypothetical protein
MAHLKKSIVEVKSEQNCLAHALIIAKAKIEKHHNYKAYIQGRKIRLEVQNLLQLTGIDLQHGGGIPELEKFQNYFKEYRIVVYEGLNCEQIIYDGMGESQKRLNLLYDEVTRHYHVITSLTGAMAKRYVCRECGKGCENAETHKCAHACSDCMSVPPCFSLAPGSCAANVTRLSEVKSALPNIKVTCSRETYPSAKDCVCHVWRRHPA